MNPVALAFALARRDLRGAIKGFRVFLACLALGVAAIAAVGSVGAAVKAGIAADARRLLGGDIELRLIHREADPEQRQALLAAGRLSETAELRAMAANPDGSARRLVELKAVDEAYPLYGSVALERPNGAEPPDLATALAFAEGSWGAVAEAGLLPRLGLAVGDEVAVGGVKYRIRAVLRTEPDRGASVFSLGPRLMVALASLPETGLVQPGSLIARHYRLALPEGKAPEVAASLKEAFPKAGWRIRTLDQAAPALERFLDRTTLYLTLVGLSALLVGGLGVANAVASHLAGKTATIATLKCLGASRRLILGVYLLQTMAMAALGVAIGLALGGAAPALAAPLLAERFGLPIRPGLYLVPLAVAGGFGLLSALAFSLWPLGRATEIPAATLFRDLVERRRRRPDSPVLIGLVAAALALVGLAVLTAADRALALGFVVGAAAALLLFRAAAALLALGAERLEGSKTVGPGLAAGAPRPGLRLALANLHRPGAATASVVVSLGLGLTVLIAVLLVEGSLDREIDETLPEAAPTFYFIDIQSAQRAPFRTLVGGWPGAADYEEVPMLRGRIVALDGVPADRAPVAPEVAWVLQGDRGITWATEPPADADIVAGRWWEPDHRGPLLVSVDAEIAQGLGLRVGDTLTVNLLGREVTAEIANLRTVDWDRLGINFVMIFSPGEIEAAPQTGLATVRLPSDEEDALEKAVLDRFPNVSAIRVKEALESAAAILDAVGRAIRAVVVVTLASGLLVLAGVAAATYRRRVYEAVVLKVLGATRGQVLASMLLEYALLGLGAATVAALLGTLAGWILVAFVLEVGWSFAPGPVLLVLAGGVVLTLAFGLAGSARALGVRPAPWLRNP